MFSTWFRLKEKQRERKVKGDSRMHAKWQKYQAYIINFMPEISRWIIFFVLLLLLDICARKMTRALCEEFNLCFSVILFSVVSYDQRFKSGFETFARSLYPAKAIKMFALTGLTNGIHFVNHKLRYFSVEHLKCECSGFKRFDCFKSFRCFNTERGEKLFSAVIAYTSKTKHL